MVTVNPEGAELSPLSFAEMRAHLYGRRRALGIDFFAGLGGMTSSFFLAGGEILHACNHWTKSWLAHGSNFPDVEHELGDLSVLDPKRLPRGFANILVCAPECRRHSNANNWRQAVMELAPYDPNRREGERSRATMWCPQRWAAYHHFEHVVVENVVEVTAWNQFANWCMEWEKIGYGVQAVCLNSAFFFAPQSRDRIAILATRHGLPLPNLDFRPLAWCWMCEQHVYGIQRYKRAALARCGPLGPTGKFGPKNQYLYRCPCCEGIVSPHVRPALSALDLSIPAVRICDRDVPLKPNTMGRIGRAVKERGTCTQVVNVVGRDGNKHPRPAWLPALGVELEASEHEPTVVPLRRNTRAPSRGEPAPSVCAAGLHHAIVGPDQEGAVPRQATQPCATVTAAGNHMVAQPPPLIGANHENSRARPAAREPAAVLTAGAAGGGLYLVGGGRENNRPRDSSVEPAATVTAAHSGGGLYMVAPANPGGGDPTADCHAGLSGVPGADGFLVQVAGNTFEREGYTRAWPLQGPSPTQSTTQERGVVLPPGGRRRASDEALIASYYGNGTNARAVSQPAGTQTAKDRHALLSPTSPAGELASSARPHSAPVDLSQYTFRMLVPKEAQALMDLAVRADGEIYKTIELTDAGNGVKITGTDSVRLSGNAVCQTQWANILHRVFCVAEDRSDPRSFA